MHIRVKTIPNHPFVPETFRKYHRGHTTFIVVLHRDSVNNDRADSVHLKSSPRSDTAPSCQQPQQQQQRGRARWRSICIPRTRAITDCLPALAKIASSFSLCMCVSVAYPDRNTHDRARKKRVTKSRHPAIISVRKYGRFYCSGSDHEMSKRSIAASFTHMLA